MEVLLALAIMLICCYLILTWQFNPELYMSGDLNTICIKGKKLNNSTKVYWTRIDKVFWHFYVKGSTFVEHEGMFIKVGKPLKKR